MRALDRKVLRDLGRLRGQMIAVAIVVCCGVATFVAMRSSYGALLASRTAYYDEYRFADVFAHVKRAPLGVARQLAAIPGVARVEPRVVAEVTLDVPGLDEPATGRLVSVPTERETGLNAIFLRSGSLPARVRPDDVVASEAFAEANGLAIGDTVGAVVNGRWRRLRVCGIGLSPEYVYEIRGFASLLPDNRRFGVLWIGEEALAAAFDLTGAFNDVAIALAPGASEAEVVARIDAALDRYGGAGAYGREDQVSARFLADEIRGQRASGFYSPAVFLAVAAFLLHLVLTRLVGTQREQIAVLKAFGYGEATIGWHYAKLALAAVLAGAVVGVPLGLWLGWLLAGLHAQYYRFPEQIFGANGAEIAFGVVVTALAACLGAFSSVRRAVSLPPAEAMRPAPPAVFRPLLVERLNLHHLISPATRMLLRNVERRPGRALLSILGIAMAVAIVVLGRSMFDSVTYLSAVQFQDVQRDDVTVAFVEPRPESALADLRHLPGVLRVEPFRAAPVELRNGHRWRRVSILGMSRGGDLRRAVSLDRRAVELPDEGLLLTSRLAELLGVAPGDLVRVRVLEGDRREREVSVAAIVDEPMGLNAYMETRSLAVLLGEQGSVSGAFLEVDPLEEPALFRRLKAAPAVGGVSLRSATIESFEQTISQNMAISSTTIFVFAIVIAAAVVYNGARIALSERQHELATLRVLGFTFREVGLLLFGEQVILTVAAMPVGFALGWLFSAWIKTTINSDLMRLPIGTDPSGFAVAFLVVSAAAVLSGAVVWRRVRRLDMVEALKVRE
jgi:putative ABC transport system permease protein